ncbi:hypothetical protein NIES593_02170 [Hydrococcus rivularis NIES-593]|uniref:Uncharacterized protein n=1 Tax=Hydrococcus rivularis NIES-593 TaxID=1921803 RepID=A0A1U7HTK9_9CYAN|nr:hypothetical protein NIES593_02170 [Hydrococcus rivularis NIES-593]
MRPGLVPLTLNLGDFPLVSIPQDAITRRYKDYGTVYFFHLKTYTGQKFYIERRSCSLEL